MDMDNEKFTGVCYALKTVLPGKAFLELWSDSDTLPAFDAHVEGMRNDIITLIHGQRPEMQSEEEHFLDRMSMLIIGVRGLGHELECSLAFPECVYLEVWRSSEEEEVEEDACVDWFMIGLEAELVRAMMSMMPDDPAEVADFIKRQDEAYFMERQGRAVGRESDTPQDIH